MASRVTNSLSFAMSAVVCVVFTVIDAVNGNWYAVPIMLALLLADVHFIVALAYGKYVLSVKPREYPAMWAVTLLGGRRERDRFRRIIQKREKRTT